MLEIEVSSSGGTAIHLRLFAETEGDDVLLDRVDAAEYNEARYQLKESCSYQYSIHPEGYTLRCDVAGIVTSSPVNQSWGRITPGIYTGLLPLRIQENDGDCADIKFEVRSVKISYREDYQHMLKEIAEHCADLIMQRSSPVLQQFTQNYDQASRSLYQKFAFVKSIVDAPDFRIAVQRIILAPASRWSEYEKTEDIRRSVKADSSILRQIASGKRRINFDHPSLGVASLPEKVIVRDKTDTVDIPENRFVKHVLSEFRSFVSFVADIMEKTVATSPGYAEARRLEEELEEILQDSFFKGLSRPQSLAINSTVLQRKGGYRDILKAWYMFDVAAKLCWDGGDDVYLAGKRDIATLYEYWVFFKLLKLMRDLFAVVPKDAEGLIEETSNRLELKLKSGRELPLEGEFDRGARRFKVRFSYNRTFSKAGQYPGSGSWTGNMRPDFTISFWPADFSEPDAEKQELITHIHFDAKYKLQNLKEVFGEPCEDLDREKEQQRAGTYKRADLLKMHAYKDAIRRTAGAYVLYPGDQISEFKGFHEILPGLGAFCLRPTVSEDGSIELKIFIERVVVHLQNRASQREHLSYHVYDSQKDSVREKDEAYATGKKAAILDAVLAETEDGTHRNYPPAEIAVLVGFVRNSNHWDWIKGTNIYNFRQGEGVRGALSLDSHFSSARYLLLHTNSFQTDNLPALFRIKRDSMKAKSREGLVDEQNYGYRPSHEAYFVIEVERVIPEKVDLNLEELFAGRVDRAVPFTVTLKELVGALKV